MSQIIAALDIGTHKICTIVAEVDEEVVRILGAGVQRSQGMSRGQVVDINLLSSAIQASIREAERSSGHRIGSALVSVAGRHVSSHTNRKQTGTDRNMRIRAEDVARVMDEASNYAHGNDREILHIIPRRFILDNDNVVSNPIGMYSYSLTVDTHIVIASKTALANLEHAVEMAGIRVDDFVLNPLASGDAVLTADEMKEGVVIIDIGGGTTDMAIFIDGVAWYMAVIATGGYQVTSDLVYLLNVPFDVAENIKRNEGHAQPDVVQYAPDVPIQPFGNGEIEYTSKYEIAQWIEARLTEILETVQKQIRNSGYAGNLPAGAVLTGGASQIPGLLELARSVLEMPVRIGEPEGVIGHMSTDLMNPSYSTSIGLLKVGLKMASADLTQANTQNRPVNGRNRFMDGVFGFLESMLPARPDGE